MRLSITKEAFLKELQLVQGVAGRRNGALPILENALIETSGEGVVRLSATDLDTSIRCEAHADVDGEGSLLVPARKLLEIVKSLPEGCEIKLRREENHWVEVRAQRARFLLASPAAEQFPNLPADGEQVHIEIDAAKLGSMIKRTAFAVADENLRYAISGVHLTCTPERVRMVSTNGHRLSLMEIETNGPTSPVQAIIPSRALNELARLVSLYEGPVSIFIEENVVYFRAGARSLATRILSGQFPNYEDILKKPFTEKAQINCALFAECLRRVALMADQRSNAVRLAFAPHTLHISAESQGEGSGEETLAIDYDGQQIDIGFNAQYLLDFLLTLKEGDVCFEFSDPLNPALLRPAENPPNCRYIYVVMPMKLTS